MQSTEVKAAPGCRDLGRAVPVRIRPVVALTEAGSRQAAAELRRRLDAVVPAPPGEPPPGGTA